MSFSAVWSERNCLAVTLNRSVILPFGLQGIPDVNHRVYVVGVNFQAGLIMCNGFIEMPHKGYCNPKVDMCQYIIWIERNGSFIAFAGKVVLTQSLRGCVHHIVQ